MRRLPGSALSLTRTRTYRESHLFAVGKIPTIVVFFTTIVVFHLGKTWCEKDVAREAQLVDMISKGTGGIVGANADLF